MNEYKNTKTGAVIQTHGEIHGGDWVPVEKKMPVKKVEK